jgi:hypothetical protein
MKTGKAYTPAAVSALATVTARPTIRQLYIHIYFKFLSYHKPMT